MERMSLEELMNVKVVTVTTASKRSEKANAAPGTVFVIDKNDIELRGYSSLKDVLRDVPGMVCPPIFTRRLAPRSPSAGFPATTKSSCW
jgi:outer membrane receptor for ferrienterochelin and colicin